MEVREEKKYCGEYTDRAQIVTCINQIIGVYQLIAPTKDLLPLINVNN